ncbi:hypothetical protein HPB48_010123 [Haemaphysalis longicornis]|uniref:Reverse transcriptase n=1 Tax=Haemaphysalis longicornis TaxID=44386 RepID=A0A9J6GXC7_HAELO|nr:hypothetical protein HPB48_010123 [Haemaphysalis longicornis]
MPYPDRPNDVPFSELEVRSMVETMKMRSPAGLHRLAATLVRSFCRAHPSFFVFVFNAALRSGRFPAVWKSGRVAFLPKPGRPPDNPSSYCPICNNSDLAKVLERLLYSHLYFSLASFNVIHSSKSNSLP